MKHFTKVLILLCVLVLSSTTVAFSQGNDELLQAVYQNDLDAVEKALNDGADINAQDEQTGDTPLLEAVRQDQIELVKLLLQKGADITITNDQGETVLHYASSIKDKELFSLLLKAGANINAKDKSGLTVLHKWFGTGQNSLFGNINAEQPDMEFGKFLLESGADATVKDNDGWDVLMYAVKAGELDFVKLVLPKVVDINAKFELPNAEPNVITITLLKGMDKAIITDGGTLLMLAVGSRNLELVKLLIEKGADVNAKTRAGINPLILACLALGNPAKAVDEVEALDDTADGTGDDNINTTSDTTDAANNVTDDPADNADAKTAKKDANGIVKLLLEKGAKVNEAIRFDPKDVLVFDGFGYFELRMMPKIFNGATPLLLASSSGNSEVVNLLLEAGADANAKTSIGVTPLLAATGSNESEIFEALLARKVDVNQKTTVTDPSDIEINVKIPKQDGTKEEIGVKINTKIFDGITPLMLAAISKNSDKANKLLDLGADAKAKSAFGATALLGTIFSKDTTLAKRLLDAGVDVNARIDLSAYITPSIDQLMAKYAKGLDAKTLQMAKMVVDILTNGTPLIFATLTGNDETVKLLVENGADPSVSTKSGFSPLMFALGLSSSAGSDDTAKLLVDKGAPVNVIYIDNMTPLMMAVEKGFTKTLKTILTKKVNLNAVDKEGRTALWYAVRNNNPEAAEILINSGARLDIASKNGQTPLVWAKVYGLNKIVAICKKKGLGLSKADKTLLADLAKLEKALATVEKAIKTGKRAKVLALMTADGKANLEEYYPEEYWKTFKLKDISFKNVKLAEFEGKKARYTFENKNLSIEFAFVKNGKWQLDDLFIDAE